jgi:hypothetical protein
MSQREVIKRMMRQVISTIRDTNLAETPRWKTVLQMRCALERNAIPAKTAEMISLLMPIKVSDSAYADEPAFIAEFVDTMAVFIARLYRQIGADMSVSPDEAIIRMAPEFKVEIEF